MPAIEQLLSLAEEHTRLTGRPLVTLSYAQSLDGSLTLSRGAPLAISSPETQRLTHQLRAMHDAILVGIGTVLADDPRLTVRLVEGADPQPVVLDSRLRMPLSARLLSGRRKPWIACLPDTDKIQQQQLEMLGAQVLPLPAGVGGVSLPDLLRVFAQRGVVTRLVGCGAQVVTISFATLDIHDRCLSAPLFGASVDRAFSVTYRHILGFSPDVAVLWRFHREHSRLLERTAGFATRRHGCCEKRD
jgi:riboflavin-specific deaminase-like protein